MDISRSEILAVFQEWTKDCNEHPQDYVPLAESSPEAQTDYFIELISRNKEYV